MSGTQPPRQRISRARTRAVKTAISLEPVLLERIDTAAASLGLPRSQLLARAADDFLRRLESRQMLAELEAVYQEGPDPEETQVRAAHRERRRRRGAGG